jgi:hypothetical protein
MTGEIKGGTTAGDGERTNGATMSASGEESHEFDGMTVLTQAQRHLHIAALARGERQLNFLRIWGSVLVLTSTVWLAFITPESRRLAEFVGLDSFLAGTAVTTGTLLVAVVLSALAITVSLYANNIGILSAAFKSDPRGMWSLLLSTTYPTATAVVLVLGGILTAQLVAFAEYSGSGVSLVALVLAGGLLELGITFAIVSVLRAVVLVRNQFQDLGEAAAGVAFNNRIWVKN